MYLNRTECVHGYSCSVYLSAQVVGYPSTMGNEYETYAPRFLGYGLIAEFYIDHHTMAGLTFGFSNPEWHIFRMDNYAPYSSEILIIPGMECNLEIEVRPNNYTEYVNLNFQQGDFGKYEWVGLPESGLPATHMDVDIDFTNSFIGTVNGVSYVLSAQDNEWSLVGFQSGAGGGQLIYDSGGEIPQGTFFASAYYSTATDWRISNTYKSEAVTTDPYGNTYNHWVLLQVTGNALILSGEHLRGLSPFNCSSDITDRPTSYKYSVEDRFGVDLSSAEFTDINGNSWTGDTSPSFEYKGAQTISVTGAFAYQGHIETINPPFDSGHLWVFNDPAPSTIGGIVCTNAYDLNAYSVTIEDEESERETTYYPNRVCVYAPLGNNLNAEGAMSFSYASNVEIDDFRYGWTISPGSISKAGFTRDLYTGEHLPQGYEAKDYLIPHLPLGNLITLHGSGLLDETNYDPNSNKPPEIVLTIGAKDRTYTYKPVSYTATDIVWDLTKPVGREGSDEGIWYCPDHLPENYEGDENNENAPYYIDEDPCRFNLYGPTLFQTISVTGLPTTENGPHYSYLKSSYSENDTFYNFSHEFEQVDKVGKQDINGQEHPILRNRQGVIAKSGRFIEIPCNQKDVTPQGRESWRFPTIGSIEGLSGSRLIFPRDDWESMEIRASSRSVTTTPQPSTNLLTEQAYIGWVGTTANALPKIKPFADTVDLEYFFNEDIDEYKCFTDIGGGWQGFVGMSGNLQLSDGATSDQIQYMLKGQVTPTALVYSVSQIEKIRRVVDTIPGVIMRFAIRSLMVKGKILRNSAGKILHNSIGKILRGNFEE